MNVRADTVNYSISLHLCRHKDIYNVTKICGPTIFRQDVSIYDLRLSSKFCTGNNFIHIFVTYIYTHIHYVEICKRQLKWCSECIFKQKTKYSKNNNTPNQPVTVCS